MFILMFLFWLLLMGNATLTTILFGLAVSAAVYLLMYKLFGVTPAKELKKIFLLWYVPAFILLIISEVIKANISVLKIIFRGGRKPNSVIVTKHVPLKTEFARAVLANSITLTPGTISVDVDGGVFTVHALDASLAEGLDDWNVIKFLSRAERKMGYDS